MDLDLIPTELLTKELQSRRSKSVFIWEEPGPIGDQYCVEWCSNDKHHEVLGLIKHTQVEVEEMIRDLYQRSIAESD